MSVSTRRVIARASIAVCLACLALQAVEVRVIHHGLAVTLLTLAAPVTGVSIGLYYLRQTRGRP